MLQFLEPMQQLVAAFVLGLCTLIAAIVNAVAQTRVAREARSKSQPAPYASRRVRRWVILGAGMALALGWSATIAHDDAQAAEGSGRPVGIRAGVASLLGTRGAAGGDALAVALLHLRRPLTDREVVRLLHAYDLRPYAIDLRLSDEPEAWLPIPVEVGPAESVPRARTNAVRRAWQQACSYESLMATLNGAAPRAGEPTGRDTLALRLVRAQAGSARDHAERLADDEAVIHGLRVLASVASAGRAAQDSAVARAEVVRYDPGWTAGAPAEPGAEGCEVVRMRNDGTVAPDVRRVSASAD